MSVEYRIEIKHGYCRLYVSGEWTREQEAKEANKIWEEIIEVSRQTEISRLIAVFDIPGRLPIMEAFEIASAPGSSGWRDHRWKIALVYPYPERFESNLFSETVAVNRGYNVKAFRNELDALAWLGIESTDEPSAR
jgi:hypothetical protein